MKVMIVEDNADSRNLLTKQLHAYGHEVAVAVNGIDALQQALKDTPDIIISDIQMPEMDGYQLCYEWKQNDRLKDIPFIFYTATYTSNEDEKFALSLGVNAFIRKPTEPEKLIQILSGILEKGRAGLLPPETEPLEPSLYLAEHNKRLLKKLDKKIRDLEREVIERKQAEIENQQLREKAEISSRLAAIGEMAAGIAHEINNPLTAVVGFSELLLDADLPPDIKAQVKIIADTSNRVKEIVRRMLTFARQTKPMKTSVSVNELINATLDLRSYILRTANIEVIKNYDPDLPVIRADPGQMQQVFLNIIVNAEYAMKKAHGKGTLTITTEKADGHIRISFKDDGMGISSENKPKLFHPFFTTKAPGEGTGLGLSLSRSIIVEHGGTIEAESEPDKGANFIITLPITPPVEEALTEATAITTASPEKGKSALILVVDDEEAIRSLASKILAQSGYLVDATGAPEEALLKLENTRYDVVIMDIHMPGMSGMELYAKIKERHPELAGGFIFATGDTLDLATMTFFEQNNLPYISKPFDRETLLQKVKKRLQ